MVAGVVLEYWTDGVGLLRLLGYLRQHRYPFVLFFFSTGVLLLNVGSVVFYAVTRCRMAYVTLPWIVRLYKGIWGPVGPFPVCGVLFR